jgi:diaminopimelate decarboxylase
LKIKLYAELFKSETLVISGSFGTFGNSTAYVAGLLGGWTFLPGGLILNYGFKTEELPLLILESGRVMIDDAGYLLGTVLANKKLSDGRKATIMDFGVNIMFTSFWYDHKISPAQEVSHFNEDTVMYGPLCMNIDIVRETVNLPLLNRGDHVVVHKVGAYNMTQWMQFIAMRPNIVLIDTINQTHILQFFLYINPIVYCR